MPKFEIPDRWLTPTIERLGELARRYEAEAAAFAAIGEAGREKAAERLNDAKEAWALRDFYLYL